MTVEVLTMGRVGVDLYPEQIGVPLAEVRTFAKSLGGSATNVAVAAARLGARAAGITKVGDDPFGPYVRRALEGFGVDPRWVGTHPTLRTPIVFCEIHPPDDFPLLFYREPTAPDMTLAVDAFGLDPDLLDVGPPPVGAVPAERVPRDTRLDAAATAAALDVELPDLDTQLARLRAEIDAARIDLGETITA